jgi:hypothetical protein
MAGPDRAPENAIETDGLLGPLGAIEAIVAGAFGGPLRVRAAAMAVGIGAQYGGSTATRYERYDPLWGSVSRFTFERSTPVKNRRDYLIVTCSDSSLSAKFAAISAFRTAY